MTSNIFSGTMPALMTPCDAQGVPNFDALVGSIGDALRRVSPEHCRNYFINSGCRVTRKNKPL